MTEREWLDCRDAGRMLALAVSGRVNAHRKALRFALACLRRTEWRLLPHQVRGLELLDRIADGTAPPASFIAADFGFVASEDRPFASQFANTAFLVCQSRKEPERPWPRTVAREAITAAQAGLDPTLAIANVLDAELHRLASVVRDIFGNPFRPVTLDRAWLTSDVTALARGIYDDRAFDRMPILADALQDAGCDNNDILNHCRDTSLTHVRGCWAIDLMLGKQ